MSKLSITDEEGARLHFSAQIHGRPGLYGAHLGIESPCGNWDATVYLSRENEDAVFEWLEERRRKREELEAST